MKHPYILIALGLLAIGFAFDRRLSRAQEGDKPVSALESVRPDDVPNVADLLERVQMLEKRIASLENRENLIRQADIRDPSVTLEPVPDSPVKSASSDDRDVEEQVTKQRINGQTWSFRLLGNR